MDWANVIKIHTPPICQTLFSPLKSMRCTTIISQPGMANYNLVPRGRVPLVPCGRETRTSGIIHFSATEILLSAQLRMCELILENGCRNGSETADLGGYLQTQTPKFGKLVHPALTISANFPGKSIAVKGI